MLLKDFYQVVNSSKEADLYISKLKIEKDHMIYQGHFPGRPVTPGVVLMQLFKEEAERRTGKKLRLNRADNVKFISVFDPTQNSELILETTIEDTGDFIKLNGVAKSAEGVVMKINSLYVAS
ncbi:hydroxymyristoyl-ACP dehydratase [Gramella sp. BOM4]|nr:hydroxymyristoyl-ACP dehydratase [Christiangramia bathymodioli]